MPCSNLYSISARSFEAARRLSAGRFGGLHGHSFAVRGLMRLGEVPSGDNIDPTEPPQTRLESVLEQLDYRLLNDLIEHPDDLAIAEWILTAPLLADFAAVELSGAANRGAIAWRSGKRQVWWRCRFEAAHQLPNVPAGHKCGRMHGHGFEACIHVDTDRSRDAHGLQLAIEKAWQPLHVLLHLGCLNELNGLDNPTSEVLAGWICERLRPELPDLLGVTVMETPTAGCFFDGQGYRIWKSMSFDSAVRPRQPLTEAPSGRIYGHTFTARLHLAGALDRVLGWVHDYGDVKRRFDPVLRQLDHQPLHEWAQLAGGDAAAIAGYLHARLGDALPGMDRIDVLTTPGSGILRCRGAEVRGLLVP